MKLLKMYILMSVFFKFFSLFVGWSVRIEFSCPHVHLSACTAVECDYTDSSIHMATGDYESSKWNSIGFNFFFFIHRCGRRRRRKLRAYVILIE